MGYSLFWLAVKGKALPDLLAQFELVPTGETEEIAESEIVAAELPADEDTSISIREQGHDGVVDRRK